MDKYKYFERFFLPVYNLRYQSLPYHRITSSNTFEAKQPSEWNPYTGMDRNQWLNSAEYLLNGIFKYVKDIEDPLFFPKQSGKSYPKIIRASKAVAHLEGLCRTLFIAVPVLKENPDLILNNIPVGAYYRNQLKNLTDPSSAIFIQKRKASVPTQHLVELGSLAMVFLLCKEVLWKPLSQEIKDKLASTMLTYGEGPYVDNNWKYFCVFILSFLKSEGYQVDEDLLKDLLGKIESDYSGDGWYLDDSYDYYSMWGYQLYAAIWSTTYGEKNYPEIARRLKNNFNEMLNFYPYLFARDGKMLMWGRSITYRFGAVAPFLFASWNDGGDVNYGWLRRISSGSLQQFLEHKNFLKQSIPTLGFHGPFEPCIQSYSCRASSFWLGKAYLGLTIAQNPFWQHKENNGPWDQYENNACYSYYSEAVKIMVTHYPVLGETEIRTSTPGNIAKAADYIRNENYNRLAYHTAFPWQADTEDGSVAMNYMIKQSDKAWEPLRQYEHVSYKEGILRRRVKLEIHTDTSIDLVDIVVPNGVLRIDRIITSGEKQVHLGHYALPEKTSKIKQTNVQTKYGTGMSIDNSEFQLLAIPVSGWKDVLTVHHNGVNPQSENSSVINLRSTVQNVKVVATLLLVKKTGEAWKEEEVDIIEKVDISVFGVEVTLKNNKLLNWEW